MGALKLDREIVMTGGLGLRGGVEGGVGVVILEYFGGFDGDLLREK